MMRSFWAIVLSELLSFPCFPQTGNPVNTVATATLWNFVALDGTVTPQQKGRLNDLSLAMNELAKRAAAQDAKAACIIGLELVHPSLQGTVPNYKLAAEWFAFSERFGDLCGSFHYGALQMGGNGVPKNTKEGWNRWWTSKYDKTQELEHDNLVASEKRRIEAAAHPAASSNSADSALAGGILLLGGAALAAMLLGGGGDNDAASSGSQQTPITTGCWVQDPYFDKDAGFTKYRSRFAYPCPN